MKTFVGLIAIISVGQMNMSRGDTAKAFAVDGTVTFDYAPDPKHPSKPTHWECPFRVQVDGCEWRIDLPECDRHIDTSSIYVFDGQVVYGVCSFPAAVAKKKLAGESVPANVATAKIQKLPFPRDLEAVEASAVWLAYCSECQFSAALQGEFPPVVAYGAGMEIFDGATPATPLESHWRLPDRAPRTPSEFESVLKVPERIIEGMNRSGIAAPLSSVTNALFNVHSTTNFGQFKVPNSATLTLVMLDPAAGFNPRVAATIKLTAVAVSTNVSAGVGRPPDLPGPTAIADERASPAVTFPNQTTWVREEETKEKAQRQKLRSTKMRVPSSAPASRLARVFVIGTLAAVAIIFGAVAYTARKQRE